MTFWSPGPSEIRKEGADLGVEDDIQRSEEKRRTQEAAEALRASGRLSRPGTSGGSRVSVVRSAVAGPPQVASIDTRFWPCLPWAAAWLRRWGL